MPAGVDWYETVLPKIIVPGVAYGTTREVWPSAVAAGLVLVAAMNLAVSDFLTVMGSHGGLAALLMMAVFILVDRFMPPPPPEVQP